MLLEISVTISGCVCWGRVEGIVHVLQGRKEKGKQYASGITKPLSIIPLDVSSFHPSGKATLRELGCIPSALGVEGTAVGNSSSQQGLCAALVLHFSYHLFPVFYWIVGLFLSDL